MPVYVDLSVFRASGTVYTAIDIATGQEVGLLRFLIGVIDLWGCVCWV